MTNNHTLDKQQIITILKQRLSTHTEGFETYLSFLVDTVENLNLSHQSKILDIGTGWGIMAISIAMHGYQVITGQPDNDDFEHYHNSDVSTHQHQNGFDFNWKDNVIAVGLQDRIAFKSLDILNLDILDGSIDAIFMFDTLHHISEREIALTECYRVLKPGGIACIIEHSPAGVIDSKDNWGIEIEQVDPRDYITEELDFGLKCISGKFLNAYILTKMMRTKLAS